MSHTRYDTQCPGCGRRVSGLSEDARRARVLVHIRNCNALKKLGAMVPLDQVAQPREPAP